MKRKPTKRKTAKKRAPAIAPKAVGSREVSFEDFDGHTIEIVDLRTGETLGNLGRDGDTESFVVVHRPNGLPFARVTKNGMVLLNGAMTFPIRIGEFLIREGIPTPPDLERAVDFYVSLEQELIEKRTASAQQPGTEPTRGTIRKSLEECFRRGFMLAMLTYADELKIAPEGLSILEKMDRGRRIAGAVRRAQAAPTHKAICKMFRELKRTIPKKMVRYMRVATKFGMSERQVARIVDGID